VELREIKKPNNQGLTVKRDYPTTFQEPISLSDMRLYMRVDYDADDNLIESMISEARAELEEKFNIAMIQDTLITFTLSQVGYAIAFPISPFQEVVEVRRNGVTLNNGTDYEVVGYGANAKVALSAYECGVIEISYKAGYNQCPNDLQKAIKILVADNYDNRDSTDLPESKAYGIAKKYNPMTYAM
jgi:uncharacterized phiE125 gp8 family phage protein